MVYADYDYYITVYGGASVPFERFTALARKASAYIDHATMGRAEKAPRDIQHAVQDATCALAEVLYDSEKLNLIACEAEKPIASETVGDWSRSYGSRAVSAVDAQMLESRKREAVSMYLAPYGLLKARGYRSCSLIP